MGDLGFLLTIALLAACGGSQPAAAPPLLANTAADECSSTASAIARAVAGGDARPDVSTATTAIAKRCADDKWSAEAIKCFGATHDEKGVHDCGYEQLTQAQQAKFDDATSALTAVTARQAMKAMAAFKDKMCGCKDSACAQEVSDEMTKWSQDAWKTGREPPRMTEKMMMQAAAIGEEMGKCMQVAMGVGLSSAQPVVLAMTGIDPPKGAVEGGTYVTISGTGFLADGPRNAKVYFGAKQGAVVRFASDTELIVEAPAGKAKQTVDVVLQFDPGGEQRLAKAFTYVKRVAAR